MKNAKIYEIGNKEKEVVYTSIRDWIKANKVGESFYSKIEIKFNANIYFKQDFINKLNVVVKDGVNTTQWGWKSSKDKNSNVASLLKFLEAQYTKK